MTAPTSCQALLQQRPFRADLRDRAKRELIAMVEPMPGRALRQQERVDFGAINRAALHRLPEILSRWLPDGKTLASREYEALNPRRSDRNPGSFRVNLRTGRWADFADNAARGGDPVSLAAYLHGLSQIEAARQLSTMLGLSIGDRR